MQRREKTRDYPETREISAFMEWMRVQHPKILCYKIQNEGKRNITLSKKLGIYSGIPDIHIIHSTNRWHSYYIEMKLPDGKGELSTNQKLCIMKLIEEKHAVDVCHGWGEAKMCFEDFIHGHYDQTIVLKKVSQSFAQSL